MALGALVALAASAEVSSFDAQHLGQALAQRHHGLLREQVMAGDGR